MKTAYIILATILLFVLNVESWAESLFDSLTSNHKFYQEVFKDCKNCKTLTIIVTEVKLDERILNSFKNISEKFGKKHMGSTMTKLQVWESFEVFDRYNCESIDQFDSQFIIYIDKDEKHCSTIPFTTIDHLMSMVNIIRKHLGDAKLINTKKWKYLTKRSIDDYSNNNPEVSATKNFLYKFIDYIDKLISKG